MSPTADQVAASWRVASPAAVHPELDDEGEPVSSGSAENTIHELLDGIHTHTNLDPEDTRILDYAGGPGRLARYLVAWFGEVTVADTSPDYLEIAAGIPGVETLLVDPIPAELPDADVILCVNLFLHIPVGAGSSLLHLFARTIPADGLLALHVPLYDHATPPATWTSVGTWTEHQLRVRAEDAGLTLVEAHTNPGTYTPGYPGPGPNHGRLHFLTRNA